MKCLKTKVGIFLASIAALNTNAQNITYEEIPSTPPVVEIISEFTEVDYSAIAFADVDGDNDQDVLITGSDSDNNLICELYIYDSEGNYNLLADTPFTGVRFSAIAFADIDGDEDQDVLITGFNSSSQSISELYTNDGDGNYTLVANTPFTGVNSGSISFADFDGDDDLDVLITGGYNDGSFQRISELYTNNGSGTFSLMSTPFTGVSLSSATFADVDDDNDQDVFITGYNASGQGVCELYKYMGFGIYILATDNPFVGVYDGSIALADIDGDTDLDLLVTGEVNFAERSTRLYTNDGNGSYALVAATPFPNISRSSVAFADVDGDNDQDLLIAGAGINEYSELYVNDSNGNYTLVADTSIPNITFGSIAFADIDNDNDSDFIITGSGDDGDKLSERYINDGLGGYTSSTAVESNFVQLTASLNGASVFADIDGDSDQDLLITGSIFGTTVNELYKNDGLGNYTPVSDSPLVGGTLSKIAFADIDGDSDQDVLITGYNNGVANTNLYTNDGDGNYAIVADTPFTDIYGGDIAFADIDNDDDQDIMIMGISAGGNITKLYTNDGTGNFTLVNETSFVGLSNGSINFFDMDGDNDQDVYLMGYNLVTVWNFGFPSTTIYYFHEIYTNDGNGNYTQVASTPFTGVSSGSADVADIDGDNDIDILISGHNGSAVITELYSNDGDGNFTLVADTPFTGVYQNDITFADIDGDNDQDIVISGGTPTGTRVIELYTNDGNGNYTLVADTPFTGGINGTLAIADIDNDNDLDLLASGNMVGNIEFITMYRNTTHIGVNYFISESGSGTADGSSIQNAAPNVEAIINNVLAGDSVKLINGVITETMPLTIPQKSLVHVYNNVVWNVAGNNFTNDGHVTLEPSSSFVQGAGSALFGAGKFEVIRQAGTTTNALNILSSPISNINVQNVFGGSNVIGFDPSSQNNGLDGWSYITSGNLVDAKGYAVSGAVIPGFSGNRHFIGQANNGDISIGLDGATYGNIADGWNLIGNPYPSAIDLNTFLTANNDVGAITFYDQSQEMYVTYNIINGAGLEIASGQGFFVEFSTANNGTASFSNSMRNNSSGTIQKTASIAKSLIRISDENGSFYETLIAFSDHATDDYNINYDARLIPGANELNIFSVINDEAFAIQALSSLTYAQRPPQRSHTDSHSHFPS